MIWRFQSHDAEQDVLTSTLVVPELFSRDSFHRSWDMKELEEIAGDRARDRRCPAARYRTATNPRSLTSTVSNVATDSQSAARACSRMR